MSVRAEGPTADETDRAVHCVAAITEGMPGWPWREIAASAYRAYAASTGNKNFRGEPMPAFPDLPVTIQTAWEAAVRQVGDVLSHPPLIKSESRWAGWVPPHLMGA